MSVHIKNPIIQWLSPLIVNWDNHVILSFGHKMVRMKVIESNALSGV